VDVVAGAAGGLAGFEVRSTTGATADSEAGLGAGAWRGTAAGAVAAVCCVACVRVTVETGARFGAAILAVRAVRTVRVLVVVAVGAREASGVTVAFGLGATGVASVTGGVGSVAGAG
jgi:hypothetical protein